MMQFRLILWVALCSIAIQAAPILGLSNTGQGLAGGAQDPNWFMIEVDQQAIAIQDSIPNTWLAHTTDSRWLWQTATGQEFLNTTRTFRFEFVIGPEFDPSTAFITGRWSADNFGLDILLNGDSTGQTVSGFTAWNTFTLASGFVLGLNTIDFVVRDDGGWAGFRAEFLDSNIEPMGSPAAVPEPGTWMLMGMGLLVTGGLLRKRSAACN